MKGLGSKTTSIYSSAASNVYKGQRLGLPTRLVLVLTGAMFAIWILAAGSAFYVISHELDEVFDSALQETFLLYISPSP